MSEKVLNMHSSMFLSKSRPILYLDTVATSANFVIMQVGTEKGKFLTVLDQRRPNNILIEIKRFPAARHIKAAILNMDYSYFNKEIVEVSQTFDL